MIKIVMKKKNWIFVGRLVESDEEEARPPVEQAPVEPEQIIPEQNNNLIDNQNNNIEP